MGLKFFGFFGNPKKTLLQQETGLGGEIFDGLHNTSLLRKKLRAAGRRIGKTIENLPPAQNLRRTTPKPRPNHIEINIEIDTESDTETETDTETDTEIDIEIDTEIDTETYIEIISETEIEKP